MKVLDVNSLQTGIDHTVTEIGSFYSQIHTIQKAIQSLIDLDDALKGETGEAIRAFYDECHLPFLTFLYNSLVNYEEKLREMKLAVDSFESDPNGYISQEFLENDVEEGLDEVEKTTIELTDDANSIIESVQDIVNVEKIDETEVVETVQRGKHRVKEIVEELHDLDQSQVASLDSVKEDLQTMKSFLSDMESKLQSGELSVKNYSTAAVRDIGAYQSIQESVHEDHEKTRNMRVHSSENKTIQEIQKEKNKALEDLDEDSQFYLNKAYQDLESGEIDHKTYDSIQSGLLQTGAVFMQNSINKVVTDQVIDEAADGLYLWVQKNSTTFMEEDLAAMTTPGQVVDYGKKPSVFKNMVRTVARGGVPILGSALDFSMQVHQGEDIGDAAIKAGAHTAIAASSVVTGAKTGALIGTLISPGIGTAIGVGVGFVLGVAGSMIFDTVYDNREEILEKTKEIGRSINEYGKSIGNAVSGVFSGLGSVFT